MAKQTEREVEVYTVSMMREIVDRKIAEDREVQFTKQLRAFMEEMAKHHAKSDAWKALTSVLESLGGGVTKCGDVPA